MQCSGLVDGDIRGILLLILKAVMISTVYYGGFPLNVVLHLTLVFKDPSQFPKVSPALFEPVGALEQP